MFCLKTKTALCLLLLAAWGALIAQDQAPTAKRALSCEEMEKFLLEAKIGAQKNIPKGVTLPKKATLEDGKMTHDAAIQTIDEKKQSFQGQRGPAELNFKDYWGFNVAGYKLAKLLDLNMVPPYVERKVGGRSASLSWWVDDSTLELDRMQKKIQPPDVDSWNKQMYVARVFNQLIRNMDANLTNFLIRDWQLWMIDFTRAFRAQKDLLNPKDLVQCDRKLLAKLKELNKPMLQKELKPYVNDMEIDGLLGRRDKIVKFFEDEAKSKGESAVLFDLPRSGQPCGAGL